MKELYAESTHKAGAFLDELYQSEEKYKTGWARDAKRNVAFANGDQSIDPSAAPIWVDDDPVVNKHANARQNSYQGDEIESIIRVLVSYMTRSKPVAETFADSKDEKSKNIAKVAQRIVEAKYDIDHEYENSRMAARLGLIVGTVFGEDYWDRNKGGYVPNEDGQGQPVLDDQGQQTSQQTGNNAVAIHTPLSISVDHSVVDFKDQPYIGKHAVVDVDWAREQFEQNEPG